MIAVLCQLRLIMIIRNRQRLEPETTPICTTLVKFFANEGQKAKLRLSNFKRRHWLNLAQLNGPLVN